MKGGGGGAAMRGRSERTRPARALAVGQRGAVGSEGVDSAPAARPPRERRPVGATWARRGRDAGPTRARALPAARAGAGSTARPQGLSGRQREKQQKPGQDGDLHGVEGDRCEERNLRKARYRFAIWPALSGTSVAPPGRLPGRSRHRTSAGDAAPRLRPAHGGVAQTDGADGRAMPYLERQGRTHQT